MKTQPFRARLLINKRNKAIVVCAIYTHTHIRDLASFAGKSVRDQKAKLQSGKLIPHS
jgi:hypothetical protein